MNGLLAPPWVTACCLSIALSAAAAAAAPVRVATWNLGELSLTAEEKAQRALELFADSVDVIALQECPDPGRPLTVAGGSDWQGVYEHSNAILSRWPIVRSGLVAANPAWARDLPWADIQPPSGRAFRIYSVHLTFNRNGNPFLGDARAVEIRRILTHARGFAGPVVLAGDFNTIGWILGGQASEPAIELVQASGYADAFGGIGGRTQALLGRLDWIYTRGFTATGRILGEYDGSDHRWLQASLSASDATPSEPPPVSDPGPLILLSAGLSLWGLTAWRRRKSREKRLARAAVQG
jgi:endonuclease/exonuclease/phosphatase family metal-dependent hydrolase